MKTDTIICPYCQKEIPLTDALYNSISQKIKEKFEKDMELERRKYISLLEEKEKKLNEHRTKLNELTLSLKKEFEKKFEERRKIIEEQMKLSIEKEYKLKLSFLEEELQSKQKKLNNLEKQELLFRKRLRDLENKEEQLELEIERRLAEERKNLKRTLMERLKNEFSFKEAEKEKIINDLKKQIEELRQKAEQSSQKLKGEVLELELQELLKHHFLVDEISQVSKGVRGADIVQKVFTRNSTMCGTILWETKRTKTFNKNWISKLKEDQRRLKAEIAVLVTISLPKEIKAFGNLEGIIVTSYELIIPLATLLRTRLIEITRLKHAALGQNEKTNLLYKYLTGTEFRQKMEVFVETLTTMQKELEQEKRAFAKIWAKREKQLYKAAYNIASLYGDMQGILGKSLPEIKNLELPDFTQTKD